MKYYYPAIFSPAEDGGYLVNFVDFDDAECVCFTDGDTMGEAIENATDVLSLVLMHLEDEQKAIPKPTEPQMIRAEAGCFVSIVAANTEEYRKRVNNRAVKKTLTIPEWLDSLAKKNGINFSGVLQEALRERLGV